MVAWFCEILRVPLVPAPLKTLQLYCAVVNHPGTLRGHLGAWRKAHHAKLEIWAGEACPIIKAAHDGGAQTLPDAQPRKRMRRNLLLMVLAWAATAGEVELGLVASWAYSFLLRVKSEFLEQASWKTVRLEGNVSKLGPIIRKHRRDLVELERPCVCRGPHKLACPHLWLTARFEQAKQRGGEPLLTKTESCLKKLLHRALRAAGVPEEELSEWTFHAFRRGAGVDLLQRTKLGRVQDWIKC